MLRDERRPLRCVLPRMLIARLDKWAITEYPGQLIKYINYNLLTVGIKSIKIAIRDLKCCAIYLNIFIKMF